MNTNLEIYKLFLEKNNEARKQNIKLAALVGQKQWEEILRSNCALLAIEKNIIGEAIMCGVNIFRSNNDDLLEFFEFNYYPDDSKNKIEKLKEAIKILLNE